MPKPVLGFICCHRVLNNGRDVQSVLEQYLEGVAPWVDAIPLMIPSLPDLIDVEVIAKRIDGLMLTGSPSNIAPALYGEPEEDASGPFDFDRDTSAMALTDALLKSGKPVFGICRGFQELNVHFGGTLVRDLANPQRQLQHHAPDDVSFDAMFEFGHETMLEKGKLFNRILGQEKIKTNSVHFQGVGKLGEGLEVLATAADGIIEAFASNCKGAPVLAVQWHPEWQPQNDENSQKIFQEMGRILRGGELII